MRQLAVNSLAGEYHPTGIGSFESGDDVEECALARTIGPDQPDDAPPLDLKANTLQHRRGAK